MREILFRGKEKNSGEWIYGDLRHISDGHGGYILCIVDNTNGRSNDVTGVEVVPETVGQDIGFYVEWVSDRDRNIHRKDLGYWLSAGTAEIVGNIYDNPELLKKE